jgi:hypothetical protein
MAIPSVTQTVLDPGLGLVERTGLRPLYVGTSSSGTANTVYTCNTKAYARTTLGEGPLVEGVCLALDQGATTVLAAKAASSVAAANSAVNETAAGALTGTVAVAGTANDNYEALIEITLGAATPLEANRFRYSLDNGYTYSEELVVPSGGTYVIPNTGLTLTFTLGTGYDTGDVFDFTCTAAYQNATDLTNVMTPIQAIPSATLFDYIVHVGFPADAAAGAAIFGAWETHAATLYTTNIRPVRVLHNAGPDTVSNIQSNFAAVDDLRVSAAYSKVYIASAKGFAGWGYPPLGVESAAGAVMAGRLISTDLGRVASGSISGVQSLGHDDFVTGGIDDYRILSMRTFPNLSGFYFTNGRIKSAVGSDYAYLQHGLIMDLACRTVYTEQVQFISMGLRTNWSRGTRKAQVAM